MIKNMDLPGFSQYFTESNPDLIVANDVSLAARCICLTRSRLTTGPYGANILSYLKILF